MTIKSDINMQMHQDLRKALQCSQPVRWGMVIDLSKCFGCHACTVACVAEKNLPHGLMLRPVHEEEVGIYPQVSRSFTPRPCMHCLRPACVCICLVKATYTSPQSGITHVDEQRCVACGKCVKACPYGARVLDNKRNSPNSMQPSTALVKHQALLTKSSTLATSSSPLYASPPKATVHKCDFCWSRVQAGLLPTCVTACMGKATAFGNLNDEKALVAQWAASPKASRLYEEKGTKPQVIYIQNT